MEENNVKGHEIYEIYLTEDRSGHASGIFSNADKEFPDFRAFVDAVVENEISGGLYAVPERRLYNFRFREAGDIPDMWTRRDNSDYCGRLRNVSEKLGIEPKFIYLQDAIFCSRHKLDPLAPENSRERLQEMEGYRELWEYMNDFKENERPNVVTYVIETDQGALLFDTSPKGKALQKEYMDFMTENFYDSRLDVSFMKRGYVMANILDNPKLNPPLGSLYRPESFGKMPENMYMDRGDFLMERWIEHYDMEPTGWNFARLSGLEAGDPENISQRNFDLTGLLVLTDKQAETVEIEGEFPYSFSYGDEFRDLAEKYKAAGSEEKELVLENIRTRASEIINRDFPDMRKESRPVVPLDGEQALQALAKGDISIIPAIMSSYSGEYKKEFGELYAKAIAAPDPVEKYHRLEKVCSAASRIISYRRLSEREQLRKPPVTNDLKKGAAHRRKPVIKRNPPKNKNKRGL